MPSFLLYFLLVFGIVLCSSIIVVWVKKFYFKSRDLNFPTTEQRVLAFFFDMAILHFVVVVSALLYGAFTDTLKEGVNAYILLIKDVGKGRLYYDIRYFEFIMVLIYALYSFIMEIVFRRSLGKMAVRIQVSSENRFLSSLLRSVLKIGVVYVWPLALLFSKCNSKRRWVQDYVGKAELVYK